MSDNLNQSSIVSITQPSTVGKPRVDLNKSDFDALITQKGYRVWHDKAIKCGCRNVKDGQALSSCRNCGGSGWIYINRTETKMVLQSMNKDTKFREWSAEKLGTVNVTKRNEEDVCYMDKITLIDALSIHNQVLFPQVYDDGVLRIRTTYNIKKIESIFSFIDQQSALKPLELGVDYNIVQGNYLEFDPQYNIVENFTITIKYKHNPSYYIIDFSRENMNTFIQDKDSRGRDESRIMPLSAVARTCHYVINETNFAGDYLIDNTQVNICNTRDINIGGIIKSIPTIDEDQRGEFESKGIIIFNNTNNCWEGYNGSEWVAIDNKIVDLWSSTDW